MTYLLSAIAANLFLTFLMRFSERNNGNRYALNIWNYLSGTIFSVLLINDRSILLSSGAAPLFLGMINGIGFTATMILIQISINKNGAPLTTTFNRLGIIIPTVLSAILFNEIPPAFKIAGLLLCIAAIIIMSTGEKQSRPVFMAGLLLVFVLGGTIDFISRVYSLFYDKDSQTCFVLYTFLSSFIISVFLYLKKGKKMTVRDAVIGIFVGIPNQLSTLLVLRAASFLPAYIVYPSYSAGLILLVNIINYLIFREKLTRQQYIATGIIAIGLVLLNIM